MARTKQSGLDLLGCDEVVGFDFGSLFQATGGLMQSVASQTASDQAQGQATAEENKKLYAATQADIVVTNKVAQAAVSAQLKSPSAKKDAADAAAAANAQDQAGAGLSDASVKARLDAANALMMTAKKNAAAKPSDGYLSAVAKAWTATVQKLQNTMSNDGKKGKKSDSSESWFTKRVIGPIPGAGVLVIGAGLLGGVGIVVKKIFFK
jgi:hypothetical protein